MKFLIMLMLIVLPLSVLAKEEKSVRVGILAGNVGLLGDVGDSSGNAIGLGGLLGYNLSEELVVDLTYLKSSHDNVDHEELSSGVSIYLDGYDEVSTYFTGGVTFVTNDIENIGKDTGFGLFAGLGVDISLKESVVAGIQGKYNKVFKQEKEVSGQNVTIVEDNYTVLFRLMVLF